MYLVYLYKRTLSVFKEKGLAAVLKEIWVYLVKLFHIPYFYYKSKQYGRAGDIEKLLDFVYQESGGLMRPIQVKSEILRLLEILEAIKPTNVLEIGTANGGTLFLFTRVCSGNALIQSIDMPGGEFGGGYPGWKASFYRSFALDSQKIILHREDSHSKLALDSVKRNLGTSKFDFIFIDGDHTYEGVKKDFEMYSPLIRDGGIIAFHDIVPHADGSGREVSVFWEEIRSQYDFEEIVEDWRQGWAGIGVIK